MIPLCDMIYSAYKKSRPLSTLKPQELIVEERNSDRIRNICVLPTEILSKQSIAKTLMPNNGEIACSQ